MTRRFTPGIKRSLHRKRDRGAALITALLLLLLLTGMTVAMVLASNSDMLINGYYRSYRGSFYAADSGLNIVRQQMVNQLVAAGGGAFSATAQPIPPGTEGTVVTSLNTTYGVGYQPLNTGNASNSWPESFKLDPAGTTITVSCTPVGGNAGATCAAPTGPVTGYQYVYNYSLRAFGRSTGNQVTTISDSGSVKINVTGAAGSTTTSFAAFGMFIDNFSICSGGYLVPGTITGPVFTNGAWTFGTAGSYIFTDSVGSANANFGYQFTGKCVQSPASSVKSGNTTIAPQFQSGYKLSQPSVPLPQNDYNQKRAVLDGMGASSNPVSNNDLNSSLKNVNRSPYPISGALSGVYLPYTVDSLTGAATFTGGGIYVKGDASVTLSTSGATGQVYKIVQAGVTTTITIDTVSNTTTMTSGATTVNIAGVPLQRDPTSGVVQRDATMLYVDGNITALSGPAQGVPAISDATALTITAASNVTITGDLLYTHEPVTQTQNQVPGTPADTLIPGNDHGQVLGIFTNKGDIQMNNLQSNKNLEIDASVATISNGGTGGLVNTGAQINTLAIVGGRIQNNIKNINSITRNVFFDRRFAQNGFAPPWFPSTTLATTGPTSAVYVPSVQRLKWLNNTAYY